MLRNGNTGSTLFMVPTLAWFLLIVDMCVAHTFNSGNNRTHHSNVQSLRFREDGTFKIVQFTDLHYGENEAWDRLSQDVQERILETEKPDLVVLTGDCVSGYAWNGRSGWFAEQWKKLVAPMIKGGYKWALTIGNHDEEADLTRDQIVELDRSYTNSLTQLGPQHIHGVTNYVLSVASFQRDHSSPPAMRLYFFDSNNANCEGIRGWGCVYPSQIEWYRQVSNSYRVAGTKVPALAFMHIPIPEFMSLWNYYTTYGTLQDEGICCASVNTGLYSVLREMNEIRALYVGHDHKNDFYGNYFGIQLGYGRKTGYGGYGPAFGVLRGARVIEVTENPFTIRTWITEETGRRVEQPIHKPGFPHYYTCCNTGDRFWIVMNRTIIITLTVTVIFWWIVMSFVVLKLILRRKRLKEKL
jgi:hypothetical protein